MTHASAALSRDFAGKTLYRRPPRLVLRRLWLVPGHFRREALRRLMTADAGVLRSGEQLREAEYVLASWAAVVRPEMRDGRSGPGEHEDRNLLLAAQLLVAAARQRTGSVGAHYRADATAAAPALPADTALPAAPALLVAPARSNPPAGAHGHRHAPRPSETKDLLMTAPAAVRPAALPVTALAGSLPAAAVDAVLRAALQEDAPYGDITSQTLIPADARATAVLAARVPGVLSGGEVFAAAMKLTDPDAAVELLVADGTAFAAGTALARVTGNARAVLLAERVALNLVQRMSAIATRTAEFVALVDGTAARITDTRKTTPGLRVLERYAVRCGGGANHRFGLSDAVLAKDNHLAVLTGGDPSKLTAVLREAKARLGHTTHFEVEVDSMDQIGPVLAAGVDTIMLDNFSLADLAAGVALVAGRARVEASGNVNLATVAGIAGTGVDVISIGGLTHSVAALDLGLDIELGLGTGQGRESGLEQSERAPERTAGRTAP